MQIDFTFLLIYLNLHMCLVKELVVIFEASISYVFGVELNNFLPPLCFLSILFNFLANQMFIILFQQ